MRDKLKLTEHLVSQLPNEHKVSVEAARTTWWFNLRPEGGFRLTSTGFKMLADQLKLEFYPYKIPDEHEFTQKTLITLDKKLQNPYYIVTTKHFPTCIIFFSSQEAMLINLYGNLAKFLDNYKN